MREEMKRKKEMKQNILKKNLPPSAMSNTHG